VNAGQAQVGARFGELLRGYRVASGLSQEELAERSGLAVRTIANMERGRTARPHRRSVGSLADALMLPESERDQLHRASRELRAGHLALVRPLSDVPAAERLGPQALPAVPRQLPAVVPYFLGRGDELRALTRMLDEAAAASGTVVITAIGGTAGVGKTALALRWAHREACRFPDGQLYVDLRGFDPGPPMPAADVLAGFLRALGVPGQEVPPELDERAARYRSMLADRRVLIVLDNAGDVDQVRPLLPGTPGCMTVVTSRDALVGLVARDGAHRLELDLLPLGDAVRLLGALIGGRVDAEPDTAAALASRCCQLPLALRVAAELAAARPTVSLADLVGELADQERRLDLLDANGDPRTAVRAVLSFSYQHLDPAAAEAFRLSGLHPGPSLDAHVVAALVGVGLQRATQLLDQLARAYLVQPAGSGRYGMHDLLRDYARELAGTVDGKAARRTAVTRLLDYYLYTAAAAMDTLAPAERHRRPHILPPGTPSPPMTDDGSARAWLDAERASLVAATEYAAANGWPGYASRLAATVFRYLDSGGYFPEASVIHGHAHRAAQEAGDRAGESTALISLGVVDLQQGRHRLAAGHLHEAISVCRETGDRIGQASALTNLGVTDLRQGRYQPAAGYLERALTLCRETGDRAGEAHALINLGFVYGRQGRAQQASVHLKRALALCRLIGDRASEARILANLAAADRQRGGHQRAADRARQSLAIFCESGNRHGEAYALDTLGRIELMHGSYQQAAGDHRRALELFREIGDPAGEAQAHNGLGDLFLAIGLPGDARGEYAAALDLGSQIGDRYEEARAHDGLARAHDCLTQAGDATGDPGQARYHRLQALTVYAELGVPEADQIRAQLATAAQAAQADRLTS
jgi:tetratricopeptide (TPR) repeat protein/transcriptional regulator with XRE-family HTH domain